MKRAEILKLAEQYTTQDRAATHGNAEDIFGDIAGLWSIYLGQPLLAHDVAALFVLFKVARFKSNPNHLDNSVDAAGYAAIMGELGAGKAGPT